MPCLWYMTHLTVQLFIQWINPEKKMQTWLPSAPRLPRYSFVLPKPPTFLILSRRGREHYGYTSLVANCLSDLCTSLHFIIYYVSFLCHPHNKLSLSVVGWISFSFFLPPSGEMLRGRCPKKKHMAVGQLHKNNGSYSLTVHKHKCMHEMMI